MGKNLKINLLILCLFFTTSKLNAQSIGGISSGAQSYCDTLNSGFITITGNIGNVIAWQYSSNGGSNWTTNGNTTTSQSYYHLKQSTCFRAIVQNGSFIPDTSTSACITIYKPTVGGTITGGGNYCGPSGPGTLSLLGNIGNIVKWQSSINGGSVWTNISNTTNTLSYSNITQNTIYRAIVQNSSFCNQDTSSPVNIVINPQTVSGSLISIGSNTVCYATNSNTLYLSSFVGNIKKWISSTNNGATWNSISNTTSIYTFSALTQSTLYRTIVQSANCIIDTTNYFKINVLPQTTVSAGPDITINQGQSITLNGSGNGIPLWLPNSPSINNQTILNPIVTPSISTNYILTLTDNHSCVISDTVLITVLPTLFNGIISSVITPNGDGFNDNWYIENLKYYPENEVTVYNIYGHIVYSKKGYNNDWQGTYNGNPLPDGTYYYIVKIDELNTGIKGSLDILRSK